MVLYYYVCTVAMKVALRLLSRWQVVGRENVPRRGPLIVVANHLNLIDPPLLAASVPRRIAFMAKEELFRSIPSAFIIRAYGAFPVRRGGVDRKALREAQRALRRGLALGMFPEGGRSSTGKLQQAHPGTSLIARNSNAPILPVAITGSEEIKGISFLLRRPRITVTIGQPIYPSRSKDKPSKASLKELADVAMRRIAELLPESYRGVYGDGEKPTTSLDSTKALSSEGIADEG